MSEVLLRLDAVMDRTGLKRSKLYGMIGEGTFPQPMKIDGCAVWPSSAVDQWIADRIAAWRDRAA
jgi:prophage regulatory protein